MQSADAEHVVTTTAVATMVLPVKGIVKDISVESSTGAVDTHVVSAVSVHVDASHGHVASGIDRDTIHELLLAQPQIC